MNRQLSIPFDAAPAHPDFYAAGGTLPPIESVQPDHDAVRRMSAKFSNQPDAAVVRFVRQNVLEAQARYRTISATADPYCLARCYIRLRVSLAMLAALELT